MPFSKLNQTIPLPKPCGYPKELKTIGDHIRKWRLDNNLLQGDIAKTLEVCEDTIVGWENRKTTPSMRHMPGIIRMIEYLPVEVDFSTFGGRITYYRYMNGLTPKEFGKLLQADPSTVRAWEANENMPYKRRKEFVEKVIGVKSAQSENPSIT